MKLLLIKIVRFVFAREPFYKFNLHIYKISLRLIGVLNSDSTQATGEEYLLESIQDNLSADVVFDIGANEGGYAKLIEKYINQAEIFCFEPGEKAYEKLDKIKTDKIHTYKLGVSKKKGTATFYDFNKNSKQKDKYPVSAMASLYKDVFTDLHREKPKSTKIKLTTIDEFVKKEKIKEIDYLKIDTEGAEYDVLLGAKKFLSKDKIKVIHFEFNEMNVYSRVFLKDFMELLNNYNFYRLMPSGFFPLRNYSPKTHEIFAFQNIVAIHKNVDWN